ncbi:MULTISPECIES: hypothetical protein [unclassified Acinetobacter]|uniref:hypothetical protein n=1 Tax=unclassified Acinetobacter TaxID=196816 RepID=UPI002447FFF9|nr:MULTISPECIES: hypothetical protein [unclassified Acinetobacter]MDH0032036.1 hypothetical protein [Acinetobacter sp. GD04021]MDH0887692.1 hypothetical protein [Acinetobacter sp. GD03873]MDH1084040.1 hypothetical protein [Acinetobacter sp. GD03983]MDH2191033.1 hypothetical protein [Acinetobacter sp. GD03645]MDH2204552.1 hypothetical protein [Acinetobacter sp. GD03647]
MTAMVSNEQQSVQPVNSAQLVGIFKAIAPRSFEKTFDGMPTDAINHAMKICIDGLNRDQINVGLAQVRDNGFCPDLAMFRKWCLGIKGFGTEQQRAVDSFKKKHAALANIIKWRSDKDTKITNAEKEAYDRCYESFVNLDYASNFERASYNVYEAFKENYVDVVNEFAEQGVVQGEWIRPVAIACQNFKREEWNDSQSEKSETEKVQAQEYINKLKELLKRPPHVDEVGGAV